MEEIAAGRSDFLNNGIGGFLIALLAIALFFAVRLYNHLVKNKHLVREAWSGIDVQLKRRHNLLPNLVSAVRAYTEYESATLVKIIRQRQLNSSTLQIRSDAENSLSHELRDLLAVVEDYPDLKANKSFLDLQKNLSALEEQIQYARRYYNGTVRNLNVMVESFPSNLIAGLFNFELADYFEIELATIRDIPELEL